MTWHAGIDADDRQLFLLQFGPQPVRCRAGLETDPGGVGRVPANELGNGLRIGGNHPFSFDLASLIGKCTRQSASVRRAIRHSAASLAPRVRGELIPDTCLWQ